MRLSLPLIVVSLALPLPAFAQARPSVQTRLSPVDEAAAFRAAGFKRIAGKWKNCQDGSDSASYTPGVVETVHDINGDGLVDAIVTEGGAMCYGMTGTSFWLVSKQAGGAWRVITSDVGIPTILPRRAAAGWPDIEVGGPGFCFPVQRWNGREYVPYRFQYEGKPCRPPRP